MVHLHKCDALIVVGIAVSPPLTWVPWIHAFAIDDIPAILAADTVLIVLVVPAANTIILIGAILTIGSACAAFISAHLLLRTAGIVADALLAIAAAAGAVVAERFFGTAEAFGGAAANARLLFMTA